MSSAVISCRGVSKVFRTGDPEQVLEMAAAGLTRAEILRRTGSTLAVYDVSFDVGPGEMFVVMGLSGCGKSTLVRLLNRLILPAAGRIKIDGQPLDEGGGGTAQAAQPADEHGVPVVRAVPAPDCAQERGVRAQGSRCPEGGAAGASRLGSQYGRAG